MRVNTTYKSVFCLLILCQISAFQLPVNRIESSRHVTSSFLKAPEPNIYLKQRSLFPRLTLYSPGLQPLAALSDPFLSLFKIGRTFSLKRFLGRWSKRIRKVATFMAIFLLLNVSMLNNPAFARSGGRMGGSFKSSPRPSMSRPSYSSRPSMPSRSYGYYGHSRPLYFRSQPRVGIHDGGPTTQLYSSFDAPVAVARRPPKTEVLLLAGTGILIASRLAGKDYGRDDEQTSALGPGFSVVSVTVALDVPNRDDPSCILSKLKRQALTTKTDSRGGVKDMMSQTALELLREERSIISVDSSYRHFRTFNEAERVFNRLSINQRSKFDRETVNNFGGKDNSERSNTAVDDPYCATAAVVSINLAIEGDSTKFSKIKTRNELRAALSRVAADSKMEDCLLSAEIMWTPEDRSETLSSQDVYADYPSLYPLID